MNNYYTDLALKIDLILAAACIALTILIIFYAFFRQIRRQRNDRALSKIKNSVYEILISGRNSDKRACEIFSASVTPGQFLDALTNRNRNTVFFNEAEQKFIKDCFMSPKRISGLERTALRSPNKWRRIEAIMALGYSDAPGAVNIINKGLFNRDGDISYFSMIALGQIASKSSGIALLEFLKDRDFYRHKIVSILENFSADILEHALGLLDNSDVEVRFWVLKLIPKFKSRSAQVKVAELTNDVSEKVRATACECLGLIGDESSADGLLKSLKDDFWLVRASAAIALYNICGEKCIPEILKLMNDGSLSVIAAIRSIMAEHIGEFLPYIDNMLQNNDAMAKKIALEVIEGTGYLKKIVKQIVTGQAKPGDISMRILDGAVRAKACFGLETALGVVERSERAGVLEIISGIDVDMAEDLRIKLSGGAGNP